MDRHVLCKFCGKTLNCLKFYSSFIIGHSDSTQNSSCAFRKCWVLAHGYCAKWDLWLTQLHTCIKNESSSGRSGIRKSAVSQKNNSATWKDSVVGSGFVNFYRNYVKYCPDFTIVILLPFVLWHCLSFRPCFHHSLFFEFYTFIEVLR